MGKVNEHWEGTYSCGHKVTFDNLKPGQQEYLEARIHLIPCPECVRAAKARGEKIKWPRSKKQQ